MRGPRLDWLIAIRGRPAKPESLMIGLSVSSLVILFIIVIFTFLGGQLEARNATRHPKVPRWLSRW
jgi:hypothetical protein